MTQDETPSSGSDPDRSTQDPVTLLLQKALAQPPEPRIVFLPGVQERIRSRTRGRYFGKRRAVFRDPVILLLATALLILLMGAVVFVVFDTLLSPSSTSKEPHEETGTSSGS